jgi:hypothetical protein
MLGTGCQGLLQPKGLSLAHGDHRIETGKEKLKYKVSLPVSLLLKDIKIVMQILI